MPAAALSAPKGRVALIFPARRSSEPTTPLSAWAVFPADYHSSRRSLSSSSALRSRSASPGRSHQEAVSRSPASSTTTTSTEGRGTATRRAAGGVTDVRRILDDCELPLSRSLPDLLAACLLSEEGRPSLGALERTVGQLAGTSLALFPRVDGTLEARARERGAEKACCSSLLLARLHL